MTQSRVRQLFLLFLIAGVLTGPVRASGPVFWTVATAAEFLRGTSDGVFVSRDGVVTAGPQITSRLTATPAQIWSLTEGQDGTLWAGTGGDGRVLRIRSGQAEEVAFDSPESNVFALAASAGRVYAATSPDGRVYVIEGTSPARPFFDPQEKYIWALAVGADGRLWVGTGNPAVIYRVDTNGTGQAVYKPPAAHVVTLARDPSGRMLAGTESPGRLYRFGPDDRPFVLLDSGLTEVRAAVATADGSVFVAAVSRGDDPAPAGGEATSVGFAQPPPTPPTAASGSTSSSTSGRRSVLYRIDPTGTWEPIWETSDVVYDIVATGDGGVLAATGPEGRLYRVEANRDVLLLTGVDAKQITRFASAPRPGARLAPFATANPGRIMSPGTGEQATATYLSGVRDTKSVATWGLIRWEASGQLALYTRSGNTERPDDSWSDWAGPYSRREGEAIKSPAARFLQWRAVLTRPSAPPAPALTSVTVAYLARNSRPVISSVTVHPPGVVFQRPFSADDGAIAGLDDLTADARRPPGDAGPPSPPPGRRMYQKGLQTLVWRAEDADGDRLMYMLQYRREGEQAWHTLRGDLSDPIVVWDTSTVADGRYVLRVTASDSLSNAADRALSGDKESDPVTVDNTPPAVTVEIVRPAGGGVRAQVRVVDAQSPIQKLEYSLAGGTWQLVYPVDGLADAPEERYEIPLSAEGDVARLMLRATDLLQNVTSVPARASAPGR
jgi:outer membrane protein assembly factor BamB